MVWCNRWLPENVLREESGWGKVGVGDAKFVFSHFSIFCVRIVIFEGDVEISCIVLNTLSNLKFDWWVHVVVW